MTEQEATNGGRIFLVIGFILEAFEEMGNMDEILDIIVKLTSIISFGIFMFLNYPRIKARIKQVLRKPKTQENE